MGQLSTDASKRSAACQIVFMVIGAVAIILRLIAKSIRDRPFMAHDFVTLFAFINMIGFAMSMCIATFVGGLGQHLDLLMLESDGQGKLEIFLKCFFSSNWFYALASPSARCGVILLYIDLFEKRRIKIISYIIAGVVTTSHVALLLAMLSYCQPMAYHWNRNIPGGHCGDTLGTELASGILNLVLDIALIITPMPTIWGLQMPQRKKLVVSGVFSIGVINIGINIGRIIQPMVSDFTDFSYSTVNATILVTAELLTALLVACVPTLGPIFSPGKFRHKYSGRRWNDDRREQHDNLDKQQNIHKEKPISRLDDEKFVLQGKLAAAHGTRGVSSCCLINHAKPVASSVSSMDRDQDEDLLGVPRDLDISPSASAHEVV